MFSKNQISVGNKFLDVNLLDIVPEQCVDDTVVTCCCNQLWISVCENWSKFTEQQLHCFGIMNKTYIISVTGCVILLYWLPSCIA